jgi:diguanylate cyclase (GGDEF)-like protein
MLDIDFFKSYNDTYGHPAGDRCIKQIGNVISRTIRRETDINARIGGEEFLIFLQDVSRDDILLLSKRLQRGIESLQIPHANTTISKYVTVSIGAAQIVPSEDNDFNTLYKMADEALYKAKESGRNCIVLENVVFAKSSPRYVIDTVSETSTYQAKRLAN